MTVATVEDLRLALTDSGAYRSGHFKLSSGRHAAEYVQCALLLQDPSRAREIGRLLARQVTDLGVDSVIAPALGGLIIGHEVAEALEVPFRFTERRDGLMTLRRGFEFRPGERILAVEDVVTTGGSTRECMDVAVEHGAVPSGVASIIDRSASQEEDLFSVPFHSLLRLPLQSYEPADCPLCAAGGVVEQPGSRS